MSKLNLSSLRVVGKKQVEDWFWIHLTKAMLMIGLETTSILCNTIWHWRRHVVHCP